MGLTFTRAARAKRLRGLRFMVRFTAVRCSRPRALPPPAAGRLQRLLRADNKIDALSGSSAAPAVRAGGRRAGTSLAGSEERARAEHVCMPFPSLRGSGHDHVPACPPEPPIRPLVIVWFWRMAESQLGRPAQSSEIFVTAED